MSSSPENFDELRRLLALKRHEQPPPGYFDHFSDKIIARIEAEGVVIHSSWWERLFPELDAKPLLACAYSLVIIGLLVVGMGASQTLDPAEETGSAINGPWFVSPPLSALAVSPPKPAAQSWIRPADAPSSFNPVISSSTAPSFLFDPNYWSTARTASYSFP
jgi:hypothetical protein